jgi:hypothetical protein
VTLTKEDEAEKVMLGTGGGGGDYSQSDYCCVEWKFLYFRREGRLKWLLQ